MLTAGTGAQAAAWTDTMSRNAARGIWERRRALAAALAAIILFVLYMSTIRPPPGPPVVRGSRPVGVLLLRHHRPFCTASVVNSPGGNLILTAAHCLGKRLASTLVFAPYYNDGLAPLGEWQVTSQVFAPHWFPGGNVNQDFAFLTLHGDVQARAGSERLGYSSPVPASVRLEGYSLTGQLTVCSRKPTTITAAGQQQLSFACPGYTSAASGGPFLTSINRHSGLGTIVGVIGGYQQGGDSPSVSYSSPFGGVVHDLYGSLATSGQLACCGVSTDP